MTSAPDGTAAVIFLIVFPSTTITTCSSTRSLFPSMSAPHLIAVSLSWESTVPAQQRTRKKTRRIFIADPVMIVGKFVNYVFHPILCRSEEICVTWCRPCQAYSCRRLSTVVKRDFFLNRMLQKAEIFCSRNFHRSEPNQMRRDELR